MFLLVTFAEERFVFQVGQRLSIAGQIGLIPSTLQLPTPQSFLTEAVLALQHVRRIVALVKSPDSTGGGWNGWLEGVICWFTRPCDLGTAREVWKTHGNQVRSSEVALCGLNLTDAFGTDWMRDYSTSVCVRYRITKGSSGRVAMQYAHRPGRQTR